MDMNNNTFQTYKFNLEMVITRVESQNESMLSVESVEVSSATHRPLVLRLLETLASCSKSVEDGDLQSNSAMLELVNFLDSISDHALIEPDNENAKSNAFEILMQLYKFLCSPSIDQAVIDALSFELLRAVAKFADVSAECMDTCNAIVDRFVQACNPRDMLSFICEALDSLSEILDASGYLQPLLAGLPKGDNPCIVLLSLPRRHFEQIKVALPIILNVLKAVTSKPCRITELADLFNKAIGISNAIHEICEKLEGRISEKLRALLGLYNLQIMALVSISMGHKTSSCLSLVSEVSHFFPYCRISYIELITGHAVNSLVTNVFEESEDDCLNSLYYVKHGACLSVIWAHISEEVALAAQENLSAVDSELQRNSVKRWQAVGMLKHVLSFAILPWELKKQTIDFLLCILDVKDSQKCDSEQAGCSMDITSLFATLQAITAVIMCAPDPMLRKKAFESLKRVLADIPPAQRVEILQALVKNSDSPSMVAILLDLVRADMFKQNQQERRDQALHTENGGDLITLFWSPTILELVELVLRPSEGGPPLLPENADAVLSALNLYRYILITESSGKTNYTGVLSKQNLQKAYNEWLLPLRSLVIGMATENREEYDEMSIEIGCALNPIELVMYRCIELVEENLKHKR
ncbi:hypothetical protein ACFE04_017854 [Oxalis oulophora]